MPIPTEVPYSKDGHMMDSGYYNSTMQPNAPMQMELEFVEFRRRTGGWRIIFKDTQTLRLWSMFQTDFEKTIKNRLFVDNKIIGEFVIYKRGQMYGIRLA